MQFETIFFKRIWGSTYTNDQDSKQRLSDFSVSERVQDHNIKKGIIIDQSQIGD